MIRAFTITTPAAAAIAAALAFATPADAQQNARYVCQGAFAGMGMEGVLNRVWQTRSEIWSYEGAFAGADGARYDFEVMTNGASGVGGAWVNHARHRESHVRLDLSSGGFSLTETTTGRRGSFTCG